MRLAAPKRGESCSYVVGFSRRVPGRIIGLCTCLHGEPVPLVLPHPGLEVRLQHGLTKRHVMDEPGGAQR